MKKLIMCLMLGVASLAMAAQKPNIVFIFIDDMGYGDIGPFGSTVNKTPNLDRVVAEGIVLRQFYVSNTACTPSRSALMTGTYAHRIGMDGSVVFPGEKRGLNPKEITIAEMLKERGYATGGRPAASERAAANPFARIEVTPAACKPAPDDILIADFEGEDYGDWKAEGDAFGARPASNFDSTETLLNTVQNNRVKSAKAYRIESIWPQPSRAAASTKRPNVIVILTDDQGYGDLSCHGNPILKTPNLDAFHQQSIRFTDFHVAPMCTPTRGQLLTGRDAMANGATFVCMGRSMMRNNLPTMADVFAANGYHTGHFGKWHLGDSYPHRPQDRGFQETIHHGAWGITSIADYYGNDYWDDTYRHNDRLEEYEGYCTDVWFDEAMDYMKARHASNEPFFVYLATNCPHSPHWVDDKYSASYEQQGLDRTTAKFFGQIANIDENMGRLLAMLDKTGIAENTLLIYMTDNGTVAGDKVFNAGMRGRKTELWEGGHRVPCFVRWPSGDLGKARDIDVLSQCQDILPTLIDLCHLDTPNSMVTDGISLAGLLRKKERTVGDRMLIVRYGPDDRAKWECTVLWSKWRLVKGEQLYDVSTDPHQDKDIAAEHPDIAAAMRKHYEQWWAKTTPQFEQPRYIHLGSEKANPVMLYSCDWKGSYADNFGNLAAGNRIGSWDVLVERKGQYRITLSRWHPAADSALDAPLEGPLGKGKAVPIAKARVKVGDVDVSCPTVSGQKQVSFTVRLEAGETQLSTWFYDGDGKEQCSAYYTRVERL